MNSRPTPITLSSERLQVLHVQLERIISRVILSGEHLRLLDDARQPRPHPVGEAPDAPHALAAWPGLSRSALPSTSLRSRRSASLRRSSFVATSSCPKREISL